MRTEYQGEIAALGVTLALLGSVHLATAQGTTAFNYQGQLRQSGTNASSPGAMIFALYDSASGGTRIGNPITNRPPLANGFFSVNLDSGVGVFTGPARWLDITVTNGGTTQTLGPRVQVSPTPYAQFATVAASVPNGSIMNAQLAGNAVSTLNLQNNAITAAQIAPGAIVNRHLGAGVVNGTNIASGQVVKTINGLTDALTFSAGSGLNLTTNGNSLQLSAAGGNLLAPSNNLLAFSSVGKQVGALSGGEYTVLTQPGAGCLTHMYFSGLGVSSMRIRVYVDGEATSSIDMANDLGTGYAFGGSSPTGNSQMGTYGGIYNNYRIPFGNGVRVTVWPMWAPADTNLWWTIRGTQNLPLVAAGQTLPATTRLKLYRNEWLTAQPLQEFNLCNVPSGNGLVYQVMVAAHGNNNNGNADLSYMEGMVRGYFNGATNAMLLSSGLEDYFLGSGYFWQNQLYNGEAAGLTSLNKSAGNNSFSAYRFHLNDLLLFQNGLRLTLRCGDQVNGQTVNTPQATTYATYTWVYQW